MATTSLPYISDNSESTSTRLRFVLVLVNLLALYYMSDFGDDVNNEKNVATALFIILFVQIYYSAEIACRMLAFSRWTYILNDFWPKQIRQNSELKFFVPLFSFFFSRASR